MTALTASAFQPYLVHFEHFLILRALARHDDAQNALGQAHRALSAMMDTLSPEDRRVSRCQIPEHRAILAAWAENQATQIEVILPRIDAPLGRPLSEDEQITVLWTIKIPDDRSIPSKSKRRRQQIRRLLHEAQAQGTVPAYRHLAEALGVSERTILRDMAVLKEDGVALPPTRGEMG
jgi:hypothetical protein